MIRCLSLLTFTDQGVREAAKSIERAGAFRHAVEAAGGRVVCQYWAMGEADGCVVFEAPDESTAASLLLSLAHLGNVRTRTLHLYDEVQFAQIASKVR